MAITVPLVILAIVIVLIVARHTVDGALRRWQMARLKTPE